MTADSIRFLQTSLPGVLVIEPRVWRDDRGFFLETWQAERYAKEGIDARFVQDNHSRSGRGTLRGLHANARRPQGKLVRCVEGEIFDVAVDIRRSSPTFGRWEGVRLTAADFRQIWVPPGFAHGFCVLSKSAHVLYKCTALYDREDEIGIVWNDPEIGILWKVENPRLSPRDASAPRLAEILHLLSDSG